MSLFSRANAFFKGNIIEGIALNEASFPVLRYFREGTKEFKAFQTSRLASINIPAFNFDMDIEIYQDDKKKIKNAGYTSQTKSQFLLELDIQTAARISTSILQLGRHKLPLGAQQDRITSNQNAFTLAQFSANHGNPAGKLALAGLLTYRTPGVEEDLEQAASLTKEIIQELDENSWTRDDAEHLLDMINMMQSSRARHQIKNQPK